MARVAVALAALVLLAGCAGVHRLGTSASGGVIPWLPLPANFSSSPEPSPQPIPVPDGTRGCTTQQLQGAVIGRNGATGRIYVGFAFSALGESACYLRGTPFVTLLDGAGQRLPFQQRAQDPPVQPVPVLVEPGPLPVPGAELKRGEAGLDIDWDTQPEACPKDKEVLVASALITVPGGGALAVKVPEEPGAYPCQGLGVSPFVTAYLPAEATPPPPLPAIGVKAPAEARVGQTLQYYVTLTDDTNGPMNLVAMCPNYEEELFADIVNGSPPLGGKHFYQLNCKPAGNLAPGQSVTFEMLLPVPGDATPGAYTLIFNLGYTNAMTKFAQEATVKISD